jgi:hypothetical protein
VVFWIDGFVYRVFWLGVDFSFLDMRKRSWSLSRFLFTYALLLSTALHKEQAALMLPGWALRLLMNPVLGDTHIL